MLVTQDATSAMGTLDVSSTFIPQGTQLLVNEGVNTLIFTDNDGCADTLTVNGHCLTSETVEITIPEQQMGTFCPDTAELPGDIFDIEFICGTCDNVGLALAPGGCFEYTGVAEGQDALTVIACDEYGVCDTTYLVINVVATQQIVSPPLVNDDFFTTEMNVPILLKVTENDIVMSDITDFGVQRTPNQGYIDINHDNTILYSPVEDYCGDDMLTYYLCVGEDCASATTNIYVECEEPRPVSGFSPNGDGINETFMIEGLEQFENNTLSIYDRRGITIYETTNYQNNWRGKWRFNDVPDGTYFYVLRYEGGKMMSGYVQIMR
jgi:gliding motility-associated-like protein